MNTPKGWLDQSRQLLEDSSDALDAATRSRLNRARQQALARATARSPLWLAWSIGGATAAVLMLASVLVLRPAVQVPAEPGVAVLAVDDAELLADDALELSDDPEFYAWLDADDDHNG